VGSRGCQVGSLQAPISDAEYEMRSLVASASGKAKMAKMAKTGAHLSFLDEGPGLYRVWSFEYMDSQAHATVPIQQQATQASAAASNQAHWSY
jgi:hypothetical protein